MPELKPNVEYKPVLPSDGFGEWGRNEAMLGCREGARTDIREPRLSWPWSSLLSRNRETFIRRGLGVLNIVRLSCQRALDYHESKRKRTRLNGMDQKLGNFNNDDVCQSWAWFIEWNDVDMDERCR